MLPTYRSPTLVQQDIAAITGQIRMAELKLVPVAALKATVAKLTSKALIDATFKGELRLAIDALESMEALHLEYNDLKARKVILENELNDSTISEGAAIRELASRRMNHAFNEFSAHALAAAVSYRALVIEARRAGYTQHLPKFHSSTLWPRSWNGIVSDSLQQNPDSCPAVNDHIKLVA
jgi:hypothetical protein